MNIVDFLSELRQLDIQISLNGDKLKIKAPQGALTKEIKIQLKDRKDEIIEFFSGAKKQDENRKIRRIENPEEIPLSFGQQRLWFFEQANPGTVANNMSSGIRLKGSLSVEIIQRVFNALSERHESLRTTFYTNEEGVPFQQVNSAEEFDLQQVSIEGSREQQEEKIEALLATETKQAFDIVKGPLVRATLVKVSTESDVQEHVLIIGMHHIISDGFSVGIFMREIAMLYLAFVRNMPSPLPPLEVQYPDFSIWQRQFLQGEGLEKQLDYWEEKLTGAPLLSTFPSDLPRPPIQTSNGANQRVEFSGDFGERLSAFATQQELTPFIVLLAAWKMLLFRYSNQQDLCVGIPTSGRNQLSLEPLIGFFVNSMVIRSDIDGQASMQDALESVRHSVVNGLDNGDIPIEMAVERLTLSRNPAYTPLIQVAFQLMVEKGTNQAMDGASAHASDLTVEALKKDSVSAKFDMTLSLTHSDIGVQGALEYNTDLYTPETILRITEQFKQVAEYLLSGDLAMQVGSFSLLSEEQRVSFVLGDQADAYEKVLPLTAMQRDLYLSSLRNAATLENSLGYAVELHHKVNVDIWREELTRFSDSQSIMRADIKSCAAPFADAAYLCIKHSGEIELDIIDLSDVEVTDLQERIDGLVRRPYSFDDQRTSTVVYYHLIKLAEEHWVALLATHHLVMDGIGYAQQLSTVFDNYEKRMVDANCTDLKVNPDLFAEYIEYDREEADKKETVDYWREQLKTVEPVDYKVLKPVDQHFRKSFTLSTDHWDSVRQYCRKNKITPTLYFKTLYGLLISHYCRADSDFVLSEFGAGRPKGHAEAVGCYYILNPFICRQSIYQKGTLVADIFRDARAQQKDRRGKLQVSVLQQSQLMSHGRIGFMYNYVHFYGELTLLGKNEVIQQLIPDAESQVQLVIKVIGADLHLFLDYHGTQFEDQDFLQRMNDISQQIIGGIENLTELSFANDGENTLLQQWSAGEEKDIAERPIQRPFEEISEASPDRTAVISGSTRWTYRQLNATANQLANNLLDNGVSTGQAIVICVSPSPWWIAGVLAILKAGCRYIPVATDYPVARVKDIVEDANAAVVLVDEASARSFENVLGQQRLVVLNDALVNEYATDTPRIEIPGSSLLYTIYTSGSTGKPKGASVTHRNAENLLAWYTDEYHFGVDSQHLVMSSIGFDLTQKNIFAPLRTGGAIVLPEMEEFDPQIVDSVIQTNNITHMNCAPSALYGLVEADDVDLASFSTLQYVLLGGEAIHLGRLRSWIDRDDCQSKLVNMYGPTECTDIAASYTIDDIKAYADTLDASLVADTPIGVPNANVKLHVLDQHQAQVVPGCVGELCISGESVGAGYLNRDQLNEECFFDYQGQRTYKTGDLVRYNDTGELVYIGRKDFQVKLRGLRIELDEIRFALARLDGVRDSLALVDGERLLGFVVADVVDDNYRPLLNEYLPAYMIPSSITLLDEWPLTPNGKVDRKQLLTLASEHQLDYEAPETETEISLAGIWSEVLNVADVSCNANFFDLGGHSLLATKIASRASQVFEIHLTVRAMFESPTIKALAKQIDGMVDGGEKKEIIPVVSREKVQSGEQRVPLSFAQQRLWLLDKIDGGSTAYNVPLAMRIKGGLNVDTLNDTINALLVRHEGLRTVFREDDNGAYQWIVGADQYQLQLMALDDIDLSDGDAVDEAIRNVVAREILRPFDLETGPLIRASAVKITERDYLLIIVAHHIVTDGWSMNVLGQELATIYVTSSMGIASPLEAPQLHYLDYAQWQRHRLDDSAVAEHLSYWQQDLQDLPNLNLPTDFVRPSVQTYAGASVPFSLSRNTREKLEAIAHSNGGTLFNALMAAFGILLNRYTGQTDFAIGTPVAGRDHPDLEKLVGFFVNTLVIRLRLDGVERFDALVRSVNQSVVNGYEHQEIPFEQIVETISPSRDMSRAPLFQAMLVYQNMGVDQQQMNQNAAQAGDISLHPVEFDVESSKFDITMSLAEIDPAAKSDFGLSGVLQYNKDLFERSTIESIASHFVSLCERLVAAPDMALSDVSMLTEAEIDQQLVQWNDTTVAYDRGQSVQQLFIEQAQKTPEYVAVSCGDGRQTYQDLDSASNLIATHLISLGVKPGDRVGICFDRSLHIMSSIIGVLKAGATYVPLDASYPAGRIQYIVEDAGIQRVLTRESIGANLPIAHCTTINTDEVLAASRAAGERGDEPVNVEPDANRLLYLIYTSGSTGRPKGTGAYHYSEVNLLRWYGEEFSMGENDRVMLMSALGFDLTQKNLFAPLTLGASLVIPTVQEYDPALLVAEIEKQQVTWINCAPSAFYDLQEDESNWPRIATLRHVFLGGEPINLMRLDAWRRTASCQLINSYGPTECTDIAAFHVVSANDGLTSMLPIGRPNHNVRLYILGANDELLPIGAVGELCISGDSVGPGYLHSAELTDEVFVLHPFGKQGEKLYRTGDLARYRKNGDVEYLGRRDQQIKLRGFRIEVGEIQAVINEQPHIVDSVVATQKVGGAVEQLVAWLVVDGLDSLDESQRQVLQESCKTSVAQMLPSHMVPSVWMLVAKFPLTPNGKIDRKALPTPVLSQSIAIIAPRNEQEQTLANIWGSVLGASDVGINQNFFELGGHSLLATKVVARVVKQTNANITVRSLFEAPTIEQFAQAIASAGLQKNNQERIKRLNKVDDIPLSYGQMRLLQFDQMNPGSSANNMPIAVRVKGVFDVRVMQKAYKELLRRHESLRTTFYATDEGEFRQRVHAKQENVLQVISLAGQDDAEEKVLEFVANDRGTCFDLMNGPLVRGALLVLNAEEGKEESVLTFCMHHIISDGVSMSVLLREMTTIYVAFAHKMPSPLPELALQYADYAEWQHSQLNEEVMSEQLDYWESHLANAPTLITLPTDRPRPSVRTTNGKSLSLTFAPDFNQRLTAFSREHGVTPFMVMLFSWQLLLSKYSQQQSVSVGVPMEGRPQSELENIIGFFINSMILNADLPPYLSLKDGLEQVRSSVLNGFANGDVPLDKVIERMNIKHSSSYTPIAQVAFQLMADAGFSTEEQSLATEFGDLSVEVVQTGGVSAKFDMLLSLHQTSSGLSGDLEFNTDLFDDSTVEELIGCYVFLSESLVANPEQLVGTVSLSSHDVLMKTLALSESDYDDAWPLTAMQRDLYFSSVSKPQTLENSLGYGVELHHKLDVKIWREELTRFTNQQSILRSEIVNCSAPFADSVYLGIRKPGSINIDVIDLSRDDVDNKRLQKRIEDLVRHPYIFDNAGNSDLVTYHLIKVAEDHWVTVMAAHHLVLDGVGIVRQLDVVLENYQKRCADAQIDELTTDPDLFAEHVRHDRQNADSKATVEYWEKELATVEPLDYKVQSPINRRVSTHQTFSAEHLDQIRKFCRKKKITPTLYFKCLYGLLINQYCRAEGDFVFSELYAGRPKGHAEGVGCYYLLNPFVCKLDMYEPGAEVDSLFSGARADQKARRDKLQLSILQQSLLMPQGRLGFMYNYIHFYPELNVMGVDEEFIQFTPNVESHVQLIVKMIGQELHTYLDYHGADFEDRDFLVRLEYVSQQIVDGVDIISDISLVTPAEMEQLSQWSVGEKQNIDESPIQRLIEQQAQTTPEATAVVCGSESLSYQQLNDKANQVAHCLTDQGVEPGQAVSVFVSRSPWWIVSVLGVVKAGCSYIPIAADYPAARVKDIVVDAAPAAVLVDSTTKDGVPEDLGQQAIIVLSDEQLSSYSTGSLAVNVADDDLLYTIYTSGSTGKPKGASVTHKNAENLYEWYTKTYDFNQDGKTLIISSPGFDLTQKNIFAPLRTGGVVVLPGVESFDPKVIGKVITDNRVTHLNCAPSALYGLLESEDVDLAGLSSLRYVLLGGETIQLERLEPWAKREDCQSRLVNMYGPTECTDIAASHTVHNLRDHLAAVASGKLSKTVPIGVPNANVSLHVLNQHLVPVVPGCIGELCISGDSVGAGYVNREELNKESFVTVDGERTYRTGDLVRYDDQGRLVYVDRKDFQTKVRGYRIELGEIENVLNTVTTVRDAVVIVREDMPGGAGLAAYVDMPGIDTEAQPDIVQGLRDRLFKNLPDYMVPASISLLDELPLNPSGKVDRKALAALPLADLGGGVDIVPPQTELQAQLVDIWQTVLGIDTLGIKQDFFQLGGHSLLATKVVSRVAKITDATVSVRTLFEAPTIELFAEQITLLDEKKSQLPAIVRIGSTEGIPLSFGQSRLWYFDQMNPGSSANNMPSAIRIKGAFTVEVLQHAFVELIRRHETLRTTFYSDQEGRPLQRILPESGNQIQVISYVGDDDAEANAMAFAAGDRATGFDLENGPLLRGTLIQLNDDENSKESILTFCMHHIISDGMSLAVLLKELTTLYMARLHNVPSPLPPLPLQYADFAQWQQTYLTDDALEEQISYWEDHLRDAPALLELPTDRPRPAVQTTNGDIRNLRFSKEFGERLNEFSRENGLTPFMVMLFSWKMLLSKYAQQESISIGVPTSGRTQQELENIIGFFINSVVLNTTLPANLSIADGLKRVRETVLGGFTNENVPVDMVFERLDIDRNPSYTPLVQVAFQLVTSDGFSPEQEALAAQFGDLSVEPLSLGGASAKFDMTMTLTQSAEGLFGDLEFNTDLFDESTIDAVVEHYQYLSESIMADPLQLMGNTDLCSKKDLIQAVGLPLEEYNDIWQLSAMQYDMLMDNLMNPTTLQSSHGCAVHLHSAVDSDLWQRCIQAFSDQSGIFRAKFVAAKSSHLDMGYFAIRNEHSVNYQLMDLSAGDYSDADIKAITDKFVYIPYDVVNDELVRFLTIKIADDHYVVVAAVHHAIQDGAALHVFWESVTGAYQQQLDSPGAPWDFPVDNFTDFVAEDRLIMDTPEVVDFWRGKLSTVEPLDFSVPTPVPEPGAYRSQEFWLEDDHWAQVKAYCRKKRITPALYFKVLYGLVINAYCRPDGDFSIQETMAGRTKDYYTTQGCFIQEIPFVFNKAAFGASSSIVDLYKDVRAFQKAIKNYRLISIGEQMALSPRGRVSFMYNYYLFLKGTEFLGEEIFIEGTPSDPSGNVQVVVTEVRGNLRINLLYHPHVFEDFGLVDRMVSISRQLVIDGVEELGQLQYVTDEAEIATLMDKWNDTEEAFDLSKTVHTRFEEQVLQTPALIAVVDDNAAYSYEILNQRANQLARYLVDVGINSGDLVGLCAERSADFLVGILGVMKAGGAYVPMDPKYPQERITYMRDNSQVSVLLSQQHLAKKVEGSDAANVVYLDSDWPKISNFENTNLLLDIPSTNRAYMIYTSGSTGQPKGAIVRHNGAVNHIEAERKALEFDRSFSFLQTAPSSSDISVWQFVGPVICGGKSVVLDEVTNAQKMFELVKEHDIDIVELVPVALQLLMEYIKQLPESERALPALRWMMATGEAVSVDLVNSWLALYPAIPVVNAYGPTEAADDVIQCAIDKPLPAGQRSVPIGKPLANLQVLILDNHQRLVPAGIPGEICISGVGVGEGYWNNPEKTDEAFVDHPIDADKGKIYRTGDLGRWLAGGSIEYLDRVDNQVKVRGFRIELGEVEAAVTALNSVREAAVIVRDDMPGGTALAAYVVPAIDDFDVSATRALLRAALPDYMVPTALVALDTLPLTPAGKVDRKSLPKPKAMVLDSGEYVAPRTTLESTLVDMWESLLPVEQVGVTDNFFDIGGHSLIGVRLMARIGQEFSISLQITELLNAPTIEKLAVVIQEENGSTEWTPLVTLKRVTETDVVKPARPLFFIHPVGGDVLCYTDIAATLPANVPVYGLQSRGFALGMDVYGSIDEMVEAYAGAILSAQTEGPYQIAAQSLGGVIALKVAEALTAKGHKVSPIFMFDTYTPEVMIKDQPSNVEIIEAAIGQPLPKNVKQLVSSGDDAWLEMMYKTARAAKILQEDFTFEQIQSVYKVALTNHELVSAIELGNIHGDVYHFAAKDVKTNESSQDGWKALGYAFTYQQSVGEHESMIRGDNAVVLGQKIKEIIARA